MPAPTPPTPATSIAIASRGTPARATGWRTAGATAGDRMTVFPAIGRPAVDKSLSRVTRACSAPTTKKPVFPRVGVQRIGAGRAWKRTVTGESTWSDHQSRMTRPGEVSAREDVATAPYKPMQRVRRNIPFSVRIYAETYSTSTTARVCGELSESAAPRRVGVDDRAAITPAGGKPGAFSRRSPATQRSEATRGAAVDSTTGF